MCTKLGRAALQGRSRLVTWKERLGGLAAFQFRYRKELGLVGPLSRVVLAASRPSQSPIAPPYVASP